MSVAEPAATALETAAAARLYERHADRVFGLCLHMLGSKEEAEDASQTTFLQACRALQRGVSPVYESAWLLTIARNVCLGRHRAGGRRKAVEYARDPHDLGELAVARDDGDGSLLGLQEALARLPELQRRAFLLREWQGRSYAEIAAELGVTVPAVEALIFRARRALAADLRGEKSRTHAVDFASLLAGIKSFLGGGAAVKVAVGAAAVATAGAAVGGAVEREPQQRRQEPARSAPVRGLPAAPADPRVERRRPSTPGLSARKGADRPAVVRHGRPAAHEQPEPPRPTPSAPADPPPAQHPQPAAPHPPVVPTAPATPPPAPAPPAPIEVPPPPTDQLPVVVPEAPEVPAVPVVPELPDVPDVPLLP